LIRPPPCSPLFPYTTLFRSEYVARRVTFPFASSSSSTTRKYTDSPGLPWMITATWPVTRAGPSAKLMLFLSVVYRYNISFADGRSEEHTSELQSRENLVCRL